MPTLPAPAPASIEARGWGWRHVGRAAWAVSGLDLRIEPGERVLMLGASGSGKSTLLQAIAGVLGGDDDGESRGELLVDGRSAQTARGRVGLVLQDPDCQVVLSRVGDDVAFGCENLAVPRDEIWRRVVEALDAVGLDVPLDYPTNALSGGQKQRLALAGVLAMRPGLILLDEPTANLDPAGVIEVREAVERVVSQTGATLVVVEHRVAVWKNLVNRVVVLETGVGLQADGEPDVVLGLNGAALAASGIWVPEFPPAKPARTPQAHPRLLHTEDLGITRVPSTILQSGIELEVRAARALALTGPNGAGKSTLALTIAGLLAPAQGRVVADELASGLSEDPISWKSRELVTRIGTVFQDPEHQFLAGTVRAELSIGPKALGWAQESTESRISEVAERLRLGHLIQANPFTLSGGEKRRLSVATVLITRPPLLVLDEPTFGQDSRTWQELVAFLAELLNEGNAIVAASHDREFIDALADEEYVMPAPLARAPRAVGA